MALLLAAANGKTRKQHYGKAMAAYGSISQACPGGRWLTVEGLWPLWAMWIQLPHLVAFGAEGSTWRGKLSACDGLRLLHLSLRITAGTLGILKATWRTAQSPAEAKPTRRHSEPKVGAAGPQHLGDSHSCPHGICSQFLSFSKPKQTPVICSGILAACCLLFSLFACHACIMHTAAYHMLARCIDGTVPRTFRTSEPHDLALSPGPWPIQALSTCKRTEVAKYVQCDAVHFHGSVHSSKCFCNSLLVMLDL